MNLKLCTPFNYAGLHNLRKVTWPRNTGAATPSNESRPNQFLACAKAKHVASNNVEQSRATLAVT
jgi:hypothetical protein